MAAPTVAEAGSVLVRRELVPELGGTMRLLRRVWEWVRMMHRGCDHDYVGNLCDRCEKEELGKRLRRGNLTGTRGPRDL
jgi:hypothetical protein